MNLPDITSFLGNSGSSGLDDMLRLIGVAAIIHVVFKGVRSLIAKPVPAQPPVAIAPASASALVPVRSAPEVIDDAIPSEIIAVIAAAISCFTNSSHRIVSIKRQSSGWEKAGRQSVLTSHRIR